MEFSFVFVHLLLGLPQTNFRFKLLLLLPFVFVRQRLHMEDYFECIGYMYLMAHSKARAVDFFFPFWVLQVIRDLMEYLDNVWVFMFWVPIQIGWLLLGNGQCTFEACRHMIHGPLVISSNPPQLTDHHSACLLDKEPFNLKA